MLSSHIYYLMLVALSLGGVLAFIALCTLSFVARNGGQTALPASMGGQSIENE